MKIAAFFGAILMAFSATAVRAEPVKMGIVTGSETGTYIQIGYNLSKLLQDKGYDLAVYPSAGSMQNIADVFDRKGVQLGIVQSDALGFISLLSSEGNLKKIAKKIKMVFPLYSEEVHVFGLSSIRTFSDLNGKRVGVGKNGSGTNITAELMLEFSGVKPAAKVNNSDADSLEALRRGEIDAFIAVGGAPMALFDRADLDESGRFHLIPIESSKIFELYNRKEFPSNMYPWSRSPVNTAAIRAVLITYDYVGDNCNNVGKIAATIRNNHSWLVANGHPKWKEVNFNNALNGWDTYRCVTEALREAPVASSPALREGDRLRDMLKLTPR